MSQAPTLIAMPRLGMTMREGRLVAWHVGVGGEVRRGEPLFVIESDKAEVEIEAPASGWLRHVFAAPGTVAACGAPLAALTTGPDEPFDPAGFLASLGRAAPGKTPADVASERGDDAPHARSRAATPPAAPVSPAARRRAADLGVDVTRVQGTGPGGRVTRADVETFAAALGERREVAPGVALEVRERGAGPLVLLLPGFGSDLSTFARLLPALSRDHHVVAVNLRGVGLSDAPGEGPLDLSMFVEDVAALAVGGAHVVGASLGAAVAIGLALAHPELVRSLALLTPLSSPDGRLRAVVDAWARLAARLTPEELGCALVPWLFSSRHLEDDARRERALKGFAEVAARVPSDTVRRMAEGLRSFGGFANADLARVRVPTLVVEAGEDLLTPNAGSLAGSIAGAQHVRVAGSGHAVTLEAAAAVEAALRRHLEAAEGDTRMEQGDGRRVEKPWGHELIWAHTERYVGKLLVIEAGKRLSLQLHERKDESILVIRGRLRLELEGDDGELVAHDLGPGEHRRIRTGRKHRFSAVERVELVEVSTPELDDVVRISDDYGREGTSKP
ncbi:MAG: alpha/beta fold hydrolase [Deltaproteobacteria bacterium]|nr:alpha/beta fold hydrolase [Deltaproteobacteria bacterium]